MSSLNDPLVHPVFKAMVQYRPQLAALAELGDDDGEIDVRLLGDQVIRNFPWPIGIEVRRLLGGAMREPDRRRLDQIFRTFERSVQFLAFTMLAQLWKARREDPFPLPASFVNEFQRRVPMVSLGNLTWMVRQFARVWKSTGKVWPVVELGDLVTDRFCDALDGWVPERNEMGHYQVNLTAEEVQRRCVMANDRLSNLLVALAFLVRYKLISSPLSADDGSVSPIHTVALVRGTKVDPVLLSPLIIEVRTSSALQGSLFSKFRSGRIYFSGSEATERTDLGSLGGYPILVSGFEEMLAAFR